MESYIVKTEALKKHYRLGGNIVKALDGVDFSVKEREFVSIIGKSGSGKSTLLHMLGGLDTPTSGHVYVDGKDLAAMTKEQLAIFRRRKVGFIFQNYNLVPDFNVYENIVLSIQLDGRPIDRKLVDGLLEMLKLQEKTEALPAALSGGQQQRVAIARAVASKPAIILADEPTGNLDTARGGGCGQKAGLPKGLRKEQSSMYSESEIHKALEKYDETGSIAATIVALGYPSRSNLHRWIKNRDLPPKEKKKNRCVNTPEHPRHPSVDLKLETIHRCFELGEDVKSVSEEIGHS